MEVLTGCLILFVHCYGRIPALLGIVALVVFLASCGRMPADLSESESEFVAGTATKHGSAGYLLASLVEWMTPLVLAVITANYILAMDSLGVLLALISASLISKWSSPRVRIDWLITTSWFCVYPILLAVMVIMI